MAATATIQPAASDVEAVYESEKAKYVAAVRAYREITTTHPDLSQDPGTLAQEIVRVTGVEHSIAVIVALASAG